MNYSNYSLIDELVNLGDKVHKFVWGPSLIPTGSSWEWESFFPVGIPRNYVGILCESCEKSLWGFLGMECIITEPISIAH